jgi:hypothetical protein
MTEFVERGAQPTLQLIGICPRYSSQLNCDGQLQQRKAILALYSHLLLEFTGLAMKRALFDVRTLGLDTVNSCGTFRLDSGCARSVVGEVHWLQPH